MANLEKWVKAVETLRLLTISPGSLGIACPGNGLRFRDDLLAEVKGLAASRSKAELHKCP